MMKVKMTALLVGFSLCASVATAQISIGWTGPSGFVLDDGTTAILTNGDAVAQLIFTASAAASRPDTSGATGDNIVWDARDINNPANVNNDFGAGFGFNYSDPTFQAGSVFVRIFEGGGDPLVAGTSFHDGPLFTVQEGPVPPQSVNAGLSGSGPGPGGSYILGGTGMHGFEQTVIPEPSVLALVALGGLMIGVRRRSIVS